MVGFFFFNGGGWVIYLFMGVVFQTHKWWGRENIEIGSVFVRERERERERERDNKERLKK